MGIREELTQELVDTMLAGAQGTLDEDGFKAGMRDLAKAELTIPGLEAFLDSGCRLSRAELDAAWVELGGTGHFPLPVATRAGMYPSEWIDAFRSRLGAPSDSA